MTTIASLDGIRICRLCKEAKCVEDFPIFKRAPDERRRNICGRCYRTRNAAYIAKRRADSPDFRKGESLRFKEYLKKPGNKERYIRLWADYRLKNAKRISDGQAEYRQKNREWLLTYWRVSAGRRRAKGVERIDRNFIAFLREYQKDCCEICGESLLHGYHIDHIEPLATGGQHESANLQLLCPRCNVGKKHRPMHAYVGALVERGVLPSLYQRLCGEVSSQP